MKTAAKERLEAPVREEEDFELVLLIAERVGRLALERQVKPGGELALWLEAETQVKRELCHNRPRR